jgi:30S ribosomal protein S31
VRFEVQNALFSNVFYSLGFTFYFYTSRFKKIVMGRGDKKTKKGKIFKGSFGKSRPANPVKKAAAPKKKD